MHRTRVVCGITALFLVTGVVVTAQRGNSAAVKPQHSTSPAPKPAAVPHGTSKAVQPASSHAPKTAPKTMKPAATAKAPKPVAPKTTKSAPQVAKTSKTAAPAPAKAVAQKPAKRVETKQVAKTEKPAKTDKPAKVDKAVKVAKVEKPEKVEKPVKAAKSTASTTPAVTPVPAPGTLTAVQQKLQKNTNLAAKLTSRLPAGTDLMTASAGFRNLGQFVAAVNVSNNLGLSFTDLKAKMVTGGMSLGQAIQAVRPLTASATIEAQRAEYDARGMIAESELEPQAVTVAAPTKTKVKAKKTGQ